MPTRSATPNEISAVAFDLFTLFDPRSVDRRVEALLGPTPFTATWKTRLFEYSWLRAAAGRYVDFGALVRDSLIYAARVHGVALTDAARSSLTGIFSELSPWPDAAAALRQLRGRGLRLAPLANFAPQMIESLLETSGLRGSFDAVISTDQARTYKPDPRAYALGESTFGLPRRRIAFAAFGGWDAAGAHWFGYPTFWVNRLGVTPDELDAPVASGPDLGALERWLDGTVTRVPSATR